MCTHMASWQSTCAYLMRGRPNECEVHPIDRALVLYLLHIFKHSNLLAVTGS